MRVYETPLTDEVLHRLIAFSADWEAEKSCHGYRKNERSDIENNRIFLAEEQGKVVGYLFGCAGTSQNASSIMPDGTPFFEIEELYVIPEMRSKGIGRALFGYAEEMLRKEGVPFLMLSTATKNHRAILHFYIDEMGMDFWSARLFKKL
ncbi:MAG: GNAT family N-acetyltransferase [Clostridia bacterium]|nr:GNAT family N-acetyltransferase [Clostridia bacterium]